MLNWFNGLQFEGLQSTADTGTENFWLNGTTAPTLFSALSTTVIIPGLLLAP